MKDEPVESTLEMWFEDTDPQPPDARQTAAQVMAEVRQTRQRGRWLPFPLFRQKAQTPTATDTFEYQPSLIPATNGQTPTVIGRTQTMFSPAKAITAAALVFGIGGVLLVAQPFGQQGSSVPGAATDTAPVAPVWVTGTESFDPACQGASSSSDDGVVVRQRGWHCYQQTWETSDPRLTGSVTAAWNADLYRREDGEYTALAAGTYDLRNEGGGWHCEYADALKQTPSEATDGLNDKTATCVGADGYDGLTAVLFFRWTGNSTSIEGLLFDGDVPPLPETTGA